jgi:hypothetical protein
MAVGQSPRHALQCPRIKPVLGLQDAGGERGFVVARQDRHFFLRDDGSIVHFRSHEMHRAAGRPGAGGQGLALRVTALECRQQGRVDVDDAVVPALDEAPRQQPHEAGQADELDLRVAQRPIERRIEFVAGRVGAMIDR